MDSTKLLYAILENAIDGILTFDERGHIESINPAALQLFGYEKVELIGKSMSILIPKTDSSIHKDFRYFFHENDITRFTGEPREVQGLRKGGSHFPFRIAVSEVKYNDCTIYTGLVHDLSDEKNAEERLRTYTAELENLVGERTRSLKILVDDLNSAKEEISLSLKNEKELNQLKSRFVSMASHEFRTPLSAIQLSAVLIEKYSADFSNVQIFKHADKIKNAVSNLTIILDDFLSLERLEAGNTNPTFKTFDLIELSEEVAEEMQLIAKKEQNIIYLHTGFESKVYLDPNLVRNCMINLISNAIKYSGEQTFIEFNTEVAADQYIITVRDNGIGIPEEDQKTLFKAFFRAHNTGTIPGTGLGLNIVSRYAGLMGGTLHFESKINEGTRFILSFHKRE